MNKHSYIFVLRPHVSGLLIEGWHEMSGDENTDKVAVFLMLMRKRTNMSIGPLVVHSDTPIAFEHVQDQIHAMSQVEREAFIAECKLE